MWLLSLLSRAGSGALSPELRLFYYKETTDVPWELNPTTKNQTHKRTQNGSLTYYLLKARVIIYSDVSTNTGVTYFNCIKNPAVAWINLDG